MSAFPRKRARFFILCGLLLGVLGAGPAWGQTDGAGDPVQEAIRLREAGDFAGAVRVLRPYAETHPEQPWAALLLAQTLYWADDAAAARGVYEQALARHPDDLNLRLEYGRMLVELLDAARARTVLLPLRQAASTAAEAETLLGQIAYWQGDLSAARKHFREALRRNPDHAQARRLLDEIRVATAPWTLAASSFRQDNQPVNRLDFSAEAGAYLTPLSTLALHVQSDRFAFDDSARTTSGLAAVLKRYWPQLRLETEVEAGFFNRSFDAETEWVGRLAAGVRLPGHLILRGTVERAPYLASTASLSTPVVTETARGLLDWDAPPGWLGQAAFSLARYPDENIVRTAYAWLLLPLVRSAPASLNVGYGYTHRDARENRFVPAAAAAPPGDLPNGLAGTYAPYYTPENLQRHEALALLVLRPARAATLRIDGSYGVYAVEDAPFLYAEPTTEPAVVLKDFYRRRFYPWRVRGQLTTAPASRLLLSLVGEHRRTAYYRTTEVGIKLVHRFL